MSSHPYLQRHEPNAKDWGAVILVVSLLVVLGLAAWGVVQGEIWDREPTPTSYINGGDGDNVRVLP